MLTCERMFIHELLKGASANITRCFMSRVMRHESSDSGSFDTTRLTSAMNVATFSRYCQSFRAAQATYAPYVRRRLREKQVFLPTHTEKQLDGSPSEKKQHRKKGKKLKAVFAYAFTSISIKCRLLIIKKVAVIKSGMFRNLFVKHGNLRIYIYLTIRLRRDFRVSENFVKDVHIKYRGV